MLFLFLFTPVWACDGISADSETPPQTETSTLSGLPWRSGAFNRHDDENRREWEAYRGAANDVQIVFPTRDSWEKLLNPWWLDAHREFEGTLVVSMPLWPQDGDLPAAADGSYDTQWRALAQLLADSGRGDAIVRLGWEFDLPGMYWHATDSTAETWTEAWERAARAMLSVAPDLQMDWNGNQGGAQTLSSKMQVFPDPDLVTYIGMDGYDWYRPVTDEASWTAEFEQSEGWKWLRDTAASHGKKVSVPEWGLYTASPESGGDNPFFIEKMLGYFADLAARGLMGYEAYFNESGSYYRGNLHPSTPNPRASAYYADRICALKSEAAAGTD